jgi:hypothetical protein
MGREIPAIILMLTRQNTFAGATDRVFYCYWLVLEMAERSETLIMFSSIRSCPIPNLDVIFYPTQLGVILDICTDLKTIMQL